MSCLQSAVLNSLIIGRVAVLVLTFNCAAWAAATDGNEPTDSVSISQDGALINAKVNGEPLRHVLSKLEAQSGIAARIDLYIVNEAALETVVYAEYTRVPLIQGLKSLLRGVDYLMMHIVPEQDETAGTSSSGIRVFLLDKGEIFAHPEADEKRVPAGRAESDVALTESSLVEALQHDDPEIRQKALRSMSTMVLDGALAIALDPITQIARGDSFPELRREALMLLGKTIGDAGYTADNVQTLMGTLEATMQDGDYTIRETAIEVLSSLPLEDASEEPAPMRLAAKQENLLIYTLESDPDPRLRERALNALSNVAEDVGNYEQYVRALELAITDSDPSIQRSAFSLLGDQDLPDEHVQRLMPALSSAVTSSEEPSLRLNALHTMNGIHHDTGKYESEFVAVLDRAMASGDPQLQSSVMDMLAGLDTPSAAAELITKTALGNSLPELRLRALDVVTKLELDQARDILSKATEDPDSQVSERAQEILQTLTPP
jgi:hypothetical protein